MIKEDFVNELFELCRKHKVNLTANVESDDPDIQHYEIDVNGAWDIRNTTDAVVVQSVALPEIVHRIKGTACENI